MSDKIFLSYFKARPINKTQSFYNHIESISQNFSFIFNSKKPKVYVTTKKIKNVILLSSFTGEISLIIDADIFKEFNKQEVESLLLYSMLKLNESVNKEKTLWCSMFMLLRYAFYPIKWPFIYVLRKFNMKAHMQPYLFYIFFFPFFYFIFQYFLRPKTNPLLLKKLSNRTDMNFLNSALEKMRLWGFQKDFSNFITRPLLIVDNESNDFIFKFKSVPLDKKYAHEEVY